MKDISLKRLFSISCGDFAFFIPSSNCWFPLVSKVRRSLQATSTWCRIRACERVGILANGGKDGDGGGLTNAQEKIYGMSLSQLELSI